MKQRCVNILKYYKNYNLFYVYNNKYYIKYNNNKIIKVYDHNDYFYYFNNKNNKIYFNKN